MLDVDAFLDALAESSDGMDHETWFVGDVGNWFVGRFRDATAEDKLEVMNAVRPTLRKAGFDICDSETREQVGCECCSGESEFSRYKGRIPSEDDRVVARIWDFQPAIDIKVPLSSTYELGVKLCINYCPMCGRRLGVAPDGNDGD